MKSSANEYQYGQKGKKRPAAPKGRPRATASALLLPLLALLCAALLVLSLFMRIKLTQTGDENVRLSQKLETLKEENRRKRIEYEFAQDLGEIERTARSRLGMSSVLERGAVRIDADTKDKAVIISDG